ncbi:hypothetical protein AURANDRAFT_29152 [Aureococcus anophagefferens]|uniref:Complex 1 LYR protein domain-containing protein n=1 Tax=Aureococcus anophagefferens TaxID=44056 RepID=F0YE39_AURAN|nr:hypothetical protein AURANDRAFT_29152 [Aureococcus anophagefferens]EGB06643.1 hypothetical protein AURANDRAFT_29152 [Aureococcus anophagefferens]|eukprot:XP_009038815.1 hypothetical protein AURANDRAFT_29152 [Aureococcus anophagefferens]
MTFAPRIERRTLFAPRKAANPEALSLYRDILRASRHFHWADKEGEPWNVVLRASARKEFEQARDEPARPAASARPAHRAHPPLRSRRTRSSSRACSSSAASASTAPCASSRRRSTASRARSRTRGRDNTDV